MSVGQEAQVRLPALNQRITPMVAASVIYVSADALAEQVQVKAEKHPAVTRVGNSMSLGVA